MTNTREKAKEKLREALIQPLRSWGISQTAGLMNWIDKHIVGTRPKIQWQDHLRWWLDERLQTIFSWFYAGSDEEIDAVWNGEIPLKYMSDRQRKQLWKPASMYGVHCVKWKCWQGTFDQALSGECPVCGENVYVDPYYEAPMALGEGL